VRFGTDYEETRRLADGTSVRLRLLRREDRAKLLAGFARLSDESRYSRFFTATPRLSEAIGAVGEELMFSSNDTPPEEFAYARRLGAIINLDDITHIDCLAANGGIPELIACRFNPGGEFRIGTEIMGNPAEAKFGFTRAQLTEGFKKLKSMGAKRFGLHAFLSSCNTDNMYYPTLARLLFTTARELHEINFDILKWLVILHVAAVLFYRFILGKKIVGPMVKGTASLEPGVTGMTPAKRSAAAVCALVALARTAWVVAGAPPFST
jgi:hypothetical protein